VGFRSREAEAHAVVAEIVGQGGAAAAIQVDVTETSSVDAAVDQVVSLRGRLDVLVNNAGMTRDALLARLRDEDLEAVLDANLKGALWCARAALRPMLKQREGRIIQVTSVVGEQGNAGQTAYAASKAGLVGMTRSLALEVARRGITVNAVSPGFVETDMTAALPEAQREAVLAKIPLGRVGTPADIAPAVVYLASAAGAWVTGQVLRVNGGMYL
jgi:3-oxoacyl-[acyl-carrier protein] reductase